MPDEKLRGIPGEHPLSDGERVGSASPNYRPEWLKEIMRIGAASAILAAVVAIAHS